MPTLRDVLQKIAKHELSIEEAERLLSFFAIEEISNYAKIDVNRDLRNGLPEIILAEGKAISDLLEISLRMLSTCGRVVISRCSIEQINALQTEVSKDAVLQVHKKARMVVIKKGDAVLEASGGKVGILTAGTSDVPIAEEAKIIAQEMGCQVFSSYDVGVAGIHRLLEPLKNLILKDIDVVLVVAGREGALASVVAGLVDIPVIGVPTSNSFGFGEKGLSALMSMLQSCSLGLSVVNIDGGVAAGAAAGSIANRAAKFRNNLKN